MIIIFPKSPNLSRFKCLLTNKLVISRHKCTVATSVQSPQAFRIRPQFSRSCTAGFVQLWDPSSKGTIPEPARKWSGFSRLKWKWSGFSSLKLRLSGFSHSKWGLSGFSSLKWNEWRKVVGTYIYLTIYAILLSIQLFFFYLSFFYL